MLRTLFCWLLAFAFAASASIAVAQDGAGSSGAGVLGFGAGAVGAGGGAATGQQQGRAGAPGASALPSTATPTIPSIANTPVDGRNAATEKARIDERRDPQAANQLDPNQRNEFQDFITLSLGRGLPLFGYNLFSDVPSTFAPIDRVPVTQDYVVGPGDEIVIRAWGQVDIDYRATIDRNGAINIPRVGNINVAGIKYQELEPFLKTAIGRVFRNFELNVTLGQLRSIQIFVVGQARRPGSYTVSSLSTLVNALFASGGPSIRGSMRGIQLKRGDKVVTEFDVYDLLIKGDKSRDAKLLPGDVIYIPPVKDLVAIAGSVNEPAIYEIKPGTSLGSIVELAGGFTTTAAGQKATLERIANRKTRTVEEFTLDPAGLARPLRDGDLVQIFAVSPKFENVVTLRGSVANPGRFPWREGMRVRDIIPDKDALIVPDFWLRQNNSSRVQLSGQERLRVNVKQSFDEINWDYAVIERLRYEDLTTQLIPFNLGKAVLEGDQSNNVPLRAGDIVTIFSKSDITVPVSKQTKYVRLEGELATSGIYQILPGETLRQLVTRIGGLSPNAFLFGAEFNRESTRVFQQKRLDESIDQMEREIQRQAATNASGALSTEDAATAKVRAETQRELAARMRQFKATGRIVLEMPRSIAVTIKDLPDLVLEDGDRLMVPAMPSTVSVIGSVFNQNAFIHRQGQQLSDYLARSGGPTRDADTGSLYLIRADGTVTSRRQSNWLISGFESDQLMPGDTVVVPENLERFRLTKELKDWSQIFFQFALGVTSLKVLSDL
jgi:polysaccharide export outer membrane protein